jgi:hypothetical protein
MVDHRQQETTDPAALIRARLAAGRSIADSDIRALLAECDRLRAREQMAFNAGYLAGWHGCDSSARGAVVTGCSGAFEAWRRRNAE